MRATAVQLGVVALFGALGCASRGGQANQARFDWNVGLGTQLQSYELSMKVLRQHQFVIERETREGVLYIETRWRDRVPFEDETSLGIAAAQVRAIVRATRRGNVSEQGELFSVNLRIENRVQTRNSNDWTETITTTKVREWAQGIANDLRRELEVGVRRFGTGL